MPNSDAFRSKEQVVANETKRSTETMVDIAYPNVVDVVLRNDGTGLWVNVDGVCALRITHVKRLILTDNRK